MDANIEILFGASLIVIYAFDRFNTPSNVRASTTAGRYYMAIFLYLLIYLVTFLVFTYYPGIAGGLKEHLAANDINVDWDLVGFFDPQDSKIVFGALVLSLLVPKLPVMSKIDKKLREFLHKLALIPYEAIRRSRDMQAMDFEIHAGDRENVEIELTRAPGLTRLMIVAGGIGFMIGFIVPSWYRNSYVTEPEHTGDSSMADSSAQMSVLTT